MTSLPAALLPWFFRNETDRPISKERIPLAQSPEEKKKNRLDELYEYGKTKGTITYKEIMDRLLELEMDADQLDRVLETLEAYGVSVINETADRQVIPFSEATLDTLSQAKKASFLTAAATRIGMICELRA